MLELLNARDRALDESMKGIFAAQPDEFVRLPGEYSYTLYRKALKKNRVQIVISGGGGAGPLFPGFVADGLADAISHGDFGCAPNAYSLYEVGKAIHQGKGILYMTNNFAGDFLNNDMAQELLVTEGIPAKVVYVSDDIFSAQGEPKEKRGGLSGIGLMMKAASGAADRGMGLDEVLAVAEKTNEHMRSMAIVYNEQKKALDFGPGFSGEAPVYSVPFVSVDDMVRRAIDGLMGELDAYAKDAKLHVVLNRMPGMSYLEGNVVLNSLKCQLEERGYRAASYSAGSYFAFGNFLFNGCIITILAADEQLNEYCKTPARGYDFTI